MTPEQLKEKNRLANKKWRDANPEKEKERNRLKWLKNGKKYLANAKQKVLVNYELEKASK